jgi:predicted aldo/keto reductase-like oxidoreductase
MTAGAPPSVTPTFTRRLVPALGRSVFRLGLACNYGIDAPGFERALERGVDYVFWTAMRTSHLREPLRHALRKRRDTLTLATGPSIGYFAGSVRRGTENLLRSLGTEYIDALHLFWLGTGSAWTPSVINTLTKLKDEGKIRAIAISIHDRTRAGRLMADSPIDLFMIRYNAAHPGAERDIFPHQPTGAEGRRVPAVVAYTATSWRKLLKAPRGWTGPVMTAGDCYRFCLSSPYVDVTLSGPKTWPQLEESLDALEKGPLSADEARWMRAFGHAVHEGRATAMTPASADDAHPTP